MTKPERRGINYEDQQLIQQNAYDLLNRQAESMSPVQRCVFAAAVLTWGIHSVDDLGRAVVRGILEALDSEVFN